MIPEERAESIRDKFFKDGEADGQVILFDEWFLVEHFREAIAEERERCARIADLFDSPDVKTTRLDAAIIAARIRKGGGD